MFFGSLRRKTTDEVVNHCFGESVAGLSTSQHDATLLWSKIGATTRFVWNCHKPGKRLECVDSRQLWSEGREKYLWIQLGLESRTSQLGPWVCYSSVWLEFRRSYNYSWNPGWITRDLFSLLITIILSWLIYTLFSCIVIIICCR